MPLTVSQINAADSGRLTDGRGLYLLMRGKGKGWWRFDYRFDGRRKTLSMGVYPDTSLAVARDRREEARQLIARKIDPGSVRAAERAAKSGRDTFEAIAREWFQKRSRSWAASHSNRVIGRLEKNAFPFIGNQPIDQLTPKIILAMLRRIEGRGAIDTAHRVQQYCSQICRYAIATDRLESDPTRDLRGALSVAKKKHHASLTEPHKVGELMRAIDAFTGQYATKFALQLAALTFVRPGELRKAEWSEFDLQAKEWRIPAEKMKMARAHIVPLSSQALSILKDLRGLTGAGRYLFPSVRTEERPMSENTINAALRRLGYSKDEMTGHGFRSMASTLLNEQGYNRDWIERQLAHKEPNSVRAAYNYADYLPERRKMMQDWGDYLYELKGI